MAELDNKSLLNTIANRLNENMTFFCNLVVITPDQAVITYSKCAEKGFFILNQGCAKCFTTSLINKEESAWLIIILELVIFLFFIN
jgi:hypothetical protein